MGQHSATRARRSPGRVRAVLAGALVLGVGATMTLASWTDTEFSQASFSTSVFATESSVNGSTWANSPASPGATMAFAATAMSPNTQRYASLQMRTKPNSIAGTLQLNAGTYSPVGTDATTVLGAALRYRVVSTTATCNAAAFTGSPVWVVGGTSTDSTLGTAGSGPVNLAAATTSAGAPTGLCFEVTLPTAAASTLQGASSTVIWNVISTSIA